MNRPSIVAIALAAILVFPSAVWAHAGHTHKVMGTVTSVQGNQVEVKTTDGKTMTITLDAKTAITRGKTKLDATALKPGERVSIDAAQAKDSAPMIAKTVKLGTVVASAAAK